MKFHSLKLISLCSLFLSASASAELYFNPFVSSSVESTAFAGAPALAEDITFQYFNPAILNYHYDPEWVLVSGVVWPDSRVSFEGTTEIGTPIPGLRQTDGTNSFLPTFGVYGAYALGDHAHIGISATTPWLMRVEYPSDYVGRYYGLKSLMYSANITPVYAFSWQNFISFAAGAQFQYLNFTYRDAIDFGSIASDLGIIGALPGQQDGFQSFDGGRWGVGWTVGLLVQPCSYVRLGFGYRSEIEHEIQVYPHFDLGEIGELVQDVGGNFRNGLCADVTVHSPSYMTTGINYSQSETLDFMGAISSRNWAHGIKIKYAQPTMGESLILDESHTTFSYALGLRYRPLNRTCTFRAGVEYTGETIRSFETTPLFFGERQVLVALGLAWAMSECSTFNVAYTHTFMHHAEINLSGVGRLEPEKGDLIGHIDYDVNTLSVQFAQTF